MSIFETARVELRELIGLVQRVTEWDTTIACGKLSLKEVSAEALEAHRSRVARVEALKQKYGL
ncbi:hypothetical protein [Burkholderia cenocepacia]|uniref:hypothetical protein n=1 Tax=Burkholderia cenocepacia TaxID=95486 RepID=UPI000846E985|nr:hypothetical protein [Burkholderia cenocepacia]